MDTLPPLLIEYGDARVLCEVQTLHKIFQEEFKLAFSDFQVQHAANPHRVVEGPDVQGALLLPHDGKAAQLDTDRSRLYDSSSSSAASRSRPDTVKSNSSALLDVGGGSVASTSSQASASQSKNEVPEVPLLQQNFDVVASFSLPCATDTAELPAEASDAIAADDPRRVLAVDSGTFVGVLACEEQIDHGQIDALSTKSLDGPTGQDSAAKLGGRKKAGKNKIMQDDAGHQHSFLQRAIASKEYETFSAVLICTNAIFIGWQAQNIAESQIDQAEQILNSNEGLDAESYMRPHIIFLIGNITFAILFLVELLPRWIGEGFVDFFMTAEVRWNLLDVLVVVIGFVEAILDVMEHISRQRTAGVLQNISTMRMLRILRVVRVVRVIRVMKFFRELRMMVYSIMGSMKNLMWVTVILSVTFYLFGITFTSAVTNIMEKPSDHVRYAALLDGFGTVNRSVLTLFMSMSGGNDWAMYYDMLVDVGLFYQFAFVLFILFTLFAIVNIVTGVFVEAALASNMKDRDIIAHEELMSKRRYLESMQDVFEEMDSDEQGTISLEEFESKLQDERVIAYFNALKLDVSDARTLFRLLDSDESGEITIDEFIIGCYKLQGESRALDMKIMNLQVNALRDVCGDIYILVKEVTEHLKPETRGSIRSLGTPATATATHESHHQSWKQIFGIDKEHAIEHQDKRRGSRRVSHIDAPSIQAELASVSRTRTVQERLSSFKQNIFGSKLTPVVS